MAIAECEVLGQRSWVLANANVEMAITQAGAHMAPVEFCRDTQCVQPYYISPWQGEGLDLPMGLSERPQRGDFFCMPFGQDRDPLASESHGPHGQTSGAPWNFISYDETERVQSLAIGQQTTARVGSVVRRFSLVHGENAVYDETEVSGFAGPVTFAHHAMLRAPAEDRSLIVSTSEWSFGMVLPFDFADASTGEFQSLVPGAEFHALNTVPSLRVPGGVEDCSNWPTRRGFTDLLQIAHAERDTGFGWTAAVNTRENYVWFSLKDVRTLPSLIVWMENCGRQSSPWNGRTCVLGLEDACTYFDRGIPPSAAPNHLSKRGVVTHHVLDGNGFSIRYIQGTVRVGTRFHRVADILLRNDGIVLRDEHGTEVFTAVQVDFLHGSRLR